MRVGYPDADVEVELKKVQCIANRVRGLAMIYAPITIRFRFWASKGLCFGKVRSPVKTP